MLGCHHTTDHPADSSAWCGQRATGLPLIPGVARGPTGVIKSILDTSRTGGGRRDEIFVDIVEKISCTFNSAGSIQTSQIDGSVQVPSCLGPLVRDYTCPAFTHRISLKACSCC